MTARPDGFYGDWDVFAAELAAARVEEGSADSVWIAVLGSVASTSILAARLGKGALLGLGLGLGPLAVAGAGVLGSLAVYKAAQRGEEKKKLEKRMERARRIFRDLTRGGRRSADPAVRSEVERLFDALLYDNPLRF